VCPLLSITARDLTDIRRRLNILLGKPSPYHRTSDSRNDYSGEGHHDERARVCRLLVSCFANLFE
jgi:hypothetical protein